MTCLVIFTFCVIFAINYQIVEGGGDRIIGGVPTTITAIPYQCSLWDGGKHFCGCVLISPSYAITAAHCISIPKLHQGDISNKLWVRTGSTYSDNGGSLLDVEKATMHPNFLFTGTTEFNNDVAVIKFKNPLDADSNTFAPRANCNFKLSGSKKMLTLSGWGETRKSTDKNVLQKVRIPYVKRPDCVSLYKTEENYDVPATIECSGYSEGGKDSCQGDSGGPVSCEGNVIGIASSGFGCAHENTPGFFTNLLNENIRQFVETETGVSTCI